MTVRTRPFVVVTVSGHCPDIRRMSLFCLALSFGQRPLRPLVAPSDDANKEAVDRDEILLERALHTRPSGLFATLKHVGE